MLEALTWIYLWGWSSPKIVDALAGTKAAGLSARLVRQGILQRTRTEAGGIVSGVPIFILTLTRVGLEEIERFREKHIEYQLDPYRIRQELCRHDLLIQNATLRSLQAGTITAFRTERELLQKSLPGIKQPDAIWTRPDGSQTAVEVELTGKWGRAFDQFVVRSIARFNPEKEDQPYDEMLIITDSPALIERYKHAMQPGEPVQLWQRSDAGKYEKSRRGQVPQYAASRIHFELIQT